MAHPSLCVGMCCICYGDLTEDNTLYDDCYQGRGGIHRGLCAVMGGYYPDLAAEITCGVLIRRMHALPVNRGPEWEERYREYMRYVTIVCNGESHYDMSGP